jgi:O-acetyl-ADP-ribose deacetylase
MKQELATRKTEISHMRTVDIIEGDIAQVPANAMITAINSGGAWFGGIDGVIQRAAGMMFHQQVAETLPLNHCDTVVARKKAAHRGKFGDVVFVIDDLQSPLSKVVYAALKAASDAGYQSVSLPAIRTGVMLGTVEPNASAAAVELLRGLAKFFDEHPDSPIQNIVFVIFRQPDVLKELDANMSRFISGN